MSIWTATRNRRSSGLNCLTEPKNRSVKDVFFTVCDGLKGLPDSIGKVFSQAKVQTCFTHLLRNGFGYASKKQHWPGIA